MSIYETCGRCRERRETGEFESIKDCHWCKGTGFSRKTDSYQCNSCGGQMGYPGVDESHKHVGAAICRGKRPLCTGYNGSISGDDHCEDVGCLIESSHCVRTIHAEMNAIGQAAKEGIRIDGAKLYVTASPCWPCFSLIANVGIRRIVFGETYRAEDPGPKRVVETAKKLGIELVQLAQAPNGEASLELSPREGETLGMWRGRTGHAGVDTAAARTMIWLNGNWQRTGKSALRPRICEHCRSNIVYECTCAECAKDGAEKFFACYSHLKFVGEKHMRLIGRDDVEWAEVPR